MKAVDIFKVDSHLSFGTRPNSLDDINIIKQNGFSTVVSLVPINQELSDELKKSGINHVAVKREHLNSSIELIMAGVRLVKSIPRGKLFVHCIGGAHTSRDVAIGYLVLNGATVNEAIGRISKIRPRVRDYYPPELDLFSSFRVEFLRKHQQLLIDRRIKAGRLRRGWRGRKH